MKRKLPAFDVLVDMARNDPERLEALRAKLTQDIIDNAHSEQQKKRLAGLQFQVDMERERSRTPLQATIRISEMMCHSLADLHKSMVTPLADERGKKSNKDKVDADKAKMTRFGPELVVSESGAAKSDNVIAFRRPQSEDD
ncbi:MAG: DUF3135 domain-containing protein [Pseudomonadota bacterium]